MAFKKHLFSKLAFLVRGSSKHFTFKEFQMSLKLYAKFLRCMKMCLFLAMEIIEKKILNLKKVKDLLTCLF